MYAFHYSFTSVHAWTAFEYETVLKESTELRKGISLYQNNYLNEALEMIKSIPLEPNYQAAIHFWLGKIKYKLGFFLEARIHLEASLEALAPALPEIYFDYANILYNLQELKEARHQFELSAFNNYKKVDSLYYVGFISQLLDEIDLAKKTYYTLSKMPNMEPHMRQIVSFALAEIEFEQAKKIKNKKNQQTTFEKKIVPLLQETLKIDTQSRLVFEIYKKLIEARKLSGEIIPPENYANNQPFDSTKWNIYTSQNFGYDSNVIALANSSTLPVSQKSSLFSRNNVQVRKAWILSDRFFFAPEVDSTLLYYLNQKESLVYKNNSWSNNVAIRSRMEYSILGSPTATGIDAEWNRFQRNTNGKGNLTLFSNTYTISVHQRLQLTTLGFTKLTLAYRSFKATSDTLDASNPAITLNQLLIFSNVISMNILLGFNWYNAKTPFFAHHDIRLSYALFVMNSIPHWNLFFALDYVWANTLSSRYVRGYEKTIIPSCNISYSISQLFSLDMSYSQINNLSLDHINFDYRRSLVNLMLSLRF